MPQKTPSAIRDEVIRKYLYGMKQDEIARAVNTSEANISNIIRELKTKFDQKNIEGFVTLTRALNGENISPVQILSAVRVSSIFQQLDMNSDDETIRSFLSGICVESKRNGIEPKIVVENAIKMAKLKSQNIPLENVPEHYEHLILKIKSKEEKLEELNKELVQKKEQTTKAEEELVIQLEKTSSTVDMLEEYHANKKSLADHGVSIHDIPKISNMINQASEKGHDVSKIIECTSKEGMFEERQSHLEENIKQLSEKEKFLKNNLENLENKIKSTKSDIHDLERIASKLQNSINMIDHMKKQGVNPMQIIQWNEIIKSLGIGLQQFEDELQKSSNMTNYIAVKKAELQTLEEKITEQKSRLETLACQKIKLTSSIDEITKTTLDGIGKMRMKAMDSISSVESSSKKSIRSTADVAKIELNEVSNAAQRDQENRLSAFGDIITQVANSSEEIGRMDMLRPICDILSKSEGDPYVVYPSFITYLQKLKIWLQSQKVDHMTRTIDNLIESLKNEEEKLAIPV